MQQHKFSDLRPEYLDAPTWNPDLSAYEGVEERKSGALLGGSRSDRRPSDEADAYAAITRDERPALPEEDIMRETAMVDVPPPSDEAPGLDIEPAAEAPPASVRYVLLAGFAESGTPPEGLRTNSGLLAVELAEDSRLTTLFKPGQQYRFQQRHLRRPLSLPRGLPDGARGALVYPEGMPVDPKNGEYLHWRQLRDATSANAAAWTELR